MLKRILQILGALVALLILVVCGTIGLGLSRWDRTFDAPLPAIAASTDSAVIARGRYLAMGPARCAECHTAPAAAHDSSGAVPALLGGREFTLPIAVIRVPNITPHPTMGIGGLSDGQIARILRSGVRHDGRVLIPFMEYEHLSDQDIQALISFLRAQPPVAHQVQPHTYNVLGKMILAYVMKPPAPSSAPATSPAESVSVERGRYLAEAVATCAGCHTKRSHTDGSFHGPRYAGGSEFESNDPTMVFVSPNITPSGTGVINRFSEDQFVARFRQGPLLPGTPMPWRQFGNMTESDIRSLYRFLKTLAPVENDPGPTMRAKAD
jgi:mono/diheme cytochrome c family protein